MNQYICIHGHFYQPPRENAWLEKIELQESAFPYHDWNEKITAESYGPNAFSRMLDDQNQIINIVNNYARISYNFGSTLLSWLEKEASKTYQAILEADNLSRDYFSGHPSAMAQVYNHIIMPLANERDKRIQVEWGIFDFERRFKRKPEGMWLAETAADIKTLEVLADYGLKFTVLAPQQAHKVCKIGDYEWNDVNGSRIDPRRPYLCRLPSGKTINLFFYNGEISQEIAFRGLLRDGKQFAERLLSAFDPNDHSPQLIHIATDGESYGHHHPHGDMALASCLDHIEQSGIARITNYSEFLDITEPEYEVIIHDNSSWSCVHGVERWRSNCGCSTGRHPGDSQQWREPLRQALDWLRDQLYEIFINETASLLKDPDLALSEYIEIVDDRSTKKMDAYLSRHLLIKAANSRQRSKVIRLLEMIRQSQLMYTSCGWFFDDISGIETVQILEYANRAIQLAEGESNKELESDFLKILEMAESNNKDYPNGKVIYEKLVAPGRLTLSKVGMHYAVDSLFEEFPEKLEICNYIATSEFYQQYNVGFQRMAVGRTIVNSRITYSEKRFNFAVVYLGQHQIYGHFYAGMNQEVFDKMHQELKFAFMGSMMNEVRDIMDRYEADKTFSLWNLFKDEKRKVLSMIMEDDIHNAENDYRAIYKKNFSTMNVLRSAEIHIPDILKKTLEIVLKMEVRAVFENGRLNPSRLNETIERIKDWRIDVSSSKLNFISGKKIYQEIRAIRKRKRKAQEIDHLCRTIELLKIIDVHPDLWKSQNEYCLLLKTWVQNDLVNESNPSLDSIIQLGRLIRVNGEVFISQLKEQVVG